VEVWPGSTYTLAIVQQNLVPLNQDLDNIQSLLGIRTPLKRLIPKLFEFATSVINVDSKWQCTFEI
jgi:hypothetical protein